LFVGYGDGTDEEVGIRVTNGTGTVMFFEDGAKGSISGTLTLLGSDVKLSASTVKYDFDGRAATKESRFTSNGNVSIDIPQGTLGGAATVNLGTPEIEITLKTNRTEVLIKTDSSTTATLTKFTGEAILSLIEDNGKSDLLLGVKPGPFNFFDDLGLLVTGPGNFADDLNLDLGDTVIVFADLESEEELTIRPSGTSILDSFFAHALGGVDGGEEFQLVSGLNVVSSISLDALPAFMKDALGLTGSSNLLVQGFVAFTADNLSVSSLGIDVKLPPIDPHPKPEWMKSTEIDFSFLYTATTSELKFALTGIMDITIHEGNGDDTDLAVTLVGEFEGVGSIMVTPEVDAAEVWTTPFGIEWLDIKEFGISFGISSGIDLDFRIFGQGDITGKDISFDMFVEVTEFGVPTNFAFSGTTTSKFGTVDVENLAEQVAGVHGLIPRDAIPDFNLGPIYPSEPMLLSFALRDTPPTVTRPAIKAGFRISAKLSATSSFTGNNHDLGTAEVQLDETGIFMRATATDLELPILPVPQGLTKIKLTNLETIVELRPLASPAVGRFVLKGLLDLPPVGVGEPIHLEINLGTQSFEAAVRNAIEDSYWAAERWFKQLGTDILDTAADITTFLEDPITPITNFMDSDEVDVMFTDRTKPEWWHGLKSNIATIKDTDFSGQFYSTSTPEKTNEQIVDWALGGIIFDIKVTSGFPEGGVKKEDCALPEPFEHNDENGAKNCWSVPPFDGLGETGFLCPPTSDPLLVFRSGGLCYSVPPSDGTGKSDPPCPFWKSAHGGKCYTIPPSPGVPSPGVAPNSCLLLIESGGKCYIAPPLSGTPVGGTEINPQCDIIHPIEVIPSTSTTPCYTIPPLTIATEIPGIADLFGISPRTASDFF